MTTALAFREPPALAGVVPDLRRRIHDVDAGMTGWYLAQIGIALAFAGVLLIVFSRSER